MSSIGHHGSGCVGLLLRLVVAHGILRCGVIIVSSFLAVIRLRIAFSFIVRVLAASVELVAVLFVVVGQIHVLLHFGTLLTTSDVQ